MPVIIGHADREAHADGFWRVPKRDLMARLQIAFDFEELAIPGHLRSGKRWSRSSPPCAPPSVAQDGLAMKVPAISTTTWR